jgi:exoribonuclease R
MKTEYIVFINDRKYSKWHFQRNIYDDEEIVDLATIQPLNQRMFSKDIFTYDNITNEYCFKYSHIRSGCNIAGVLQLEGNRTYGRTANKKRLFYKCIPDDKHLPIFMIPYEPSIGFSKIQLNKYVTFRFDKWTDEYPHGILTNVLGTVDQLDVFYEYQLYCKSIYHSISDFTKNVREKLNHKPDVETVMTDPRYVICDCKDNHVFTIDPAGSADFDDGFSITRDNYKDIKAWKVSIYIANVFLWLETLNVWGSFSNRVSTIYLPDRRRPMLPTILSDTLCSLQAGENRFAFVMDIYMDDAANILDIRFQQGVICVKKNYVYEDPELLSSLEYSQLFELSQKMDSKIENSHDLVAHWMVFMNKYCGKCMIEKESGIFRLMNYKIAPDEKTNDETVHLSKDTQRVIQNWCNISGKYVLFNQNIREYCHEVMSIKNYVHVTSPIRRLVDLLNQIILLRDMGFVKSLSKSASDFLDHWIHRIDYINQSMNFIRKVQNDCQLLDRCFNNIDIMTRHYKCVVFDKLSRNDGSIMYMVYLEELKLLTRYKTFNELTNYSDHLFEIFLFEDEDKVKKKIRIQII